jgi:Fic-DOC domain mobile mystery protein B
MFGPSVPGETPIDDISGLKIPAITTRAELSRHEAANINRVILKYLASRPTRRKAPFDFSWCLQLHREMFGDVWNWAGEVRSGSLNIGVPVHRITSDLQQLLDDLHSWSGFQMDLIEQSARLHHRAAQIHPFINGNGRWSRMLANIWLKQQRSPLVVWPEETIGAVSTIREEYLVAIRAADGLDWQPLIELHRRYLG